MRVRILQCFALAGWIYKPGIVEVDDLLRDELDDLQREGWIVVIEDADDPIRLTTPESAQQPLLLRR